jgi:hypothetical protein
MWSEQPLETILKTSLGTLPAPTNDDLLGDYLQARQFVVTDIAKYIAAAEPDLTDHSEAHLGDVMSRAFDLFGDKQSYFSPHELYLLGLSILFHDTGNLHGRKAHEKKIATVYDALRKREPRFITERAAVLAIAGAHTGSAKDGTKDTLRQLNRLSFQAHRIRAAEIAAVLRLSDELAEGPHRTSAYMQNHGLHSPESAIFHKYASITEYNIDREEGRLALTYHIDLDHRDATLQVGNGVALHDLLAFSYQRIMKLDQERRYCKHYCELLLPFKETWAWFSFWHEGQKLELDPDLAPIVISDLVVPGETTKKIEDIDPNYDLRHLIAALELACKR